jgi:hypothetical protein
MNPSALEIASTMETEQEEWECCIKIGPACPHPRRLSRVVVINKVLPSFANACKISTATLCYNTNFSTIWVSAHYFLWSRRKGSYGITQARTVKSLSQVQYL